MIYVVQRTIVEVFLTETDTVAEAEESIRKGERPAVRRTSTIAVQPAPKQKQPPSEKK